MNKRQMKKRNKKYGYKKHSEENFWKWAESICPGFSSSYKEVKLTDNLTIKVPNIKD